VLCPTDTVAPFDTLAKPSYIALLDTSGVCLDSFPLLSRSIRYEGIPWNGVQFSDNSAILTAQGYGSDSTKGLFTRFLVWKVRIPEGFVEWFKSIRIHPQINEKPKAVIMPGGKIWVYGVSGANVVLVKLDSLGNQTEVQNLYTTPTSVRPILGSFLPLPDSKIAITVGYNALPPQSGNKPGAQNLIVMDTLGNTVWQISKPIPVTGSSVHGFAQIYGANIDGSINYLHDSTVGGSTYSFLEKRAADSTLLYSWPITTRTGVSATEINGVVYAGNDEAYVYGKGGDFIKGIPGDYVARVTGFGTRFDPTALPGPRARPVPLQAISLYPNPATTSLRIRSEKVLRYSIITPSGAQVQQGVLAPSKAIDIATLPPGLYLLRLQDGAASSVGRFIKN
jgi:hypothetical protein